MQIDWRRSKVAELDSQGYSQPEIARILQVSIGTVNRDLSILRNTVLKLCIGNGTFELRDGTAESRTSRSAADTMEKR
jgi:DNA-binding NarL/FixJ family response regulator